MQLPKLLPFALSAFVLFGCSSSLDSEVEKLVSAKNLWQQTGYGKNYTYTFSRNCNSQPGKPNISVINGIAHSLDEYGDTKKIENDGELFTIRGLMEHILVLIEERKAGKSKFEVEYNPVFGFPSYIRVNPKSGTMDSRYEICISNLVISGT